MKHTYLEVTFQKGKALAAYYYLPRDSKDRSVRTEAVGSGLLVDYSEDDRPIGIEITSPGTRARMSHETSPQQMAREIPGRKLAELNRVLQSSGRARSHRKRSEIAPLGAA